MLESPGAGHAGEKGDVGSWTSNVESVQCRLHRTHRSLPVFAVGDHLGDHRVVVRGDFRTLDYPCIDADAVSGRRRRCRQSSNSADRWHKAAFGILCVDPGFNGPSRIAWDVLLAQAKRLARRNPQHFLHKIYACDLLGYRMFDLQARVHFKEMELPFRIDNELDGAGRAVPHRFGQRDSLLLHSSANFGLEPRRRGLFEYLLMAALDGTLALTERNTLPMRVSENLHFNVAGTWEVAFDEYPRVTET